MQENSSSVSTVSASIIDFNTLTHVDKFLVSWAFSLAFSPVLMAVLITLGK